MENICRMNHVQLMTSLKAKNAFRRLD